MSVAPAMDRLVGLVILVRLIESIPGPFDRRAKQGADGSGMKVRLR